MNLEGRRSVENQNSCFPKAPWKIRNRSWTGPTEAENPAERVKRTSSLLLARLWNAIRGDQSQPKPSGVGDGEKRRGCEATD